MADSVIMGTPISFDKIPKYGDIIDPTYPEDAIKPIARDLTVVGNSSESWICAKVKEIITKNLKIPAITI